MSNDLDELMAALETPEKESKFRVPRPLDQVKPTETKETSEVPKNSVETMPVGVVDKLDSPRTSSLTSQEWLDVKETEIMGVLKALDTVKAYSIGDPTANLNRMHEVATNVREKQAYVLTQLTKVIEMQLEARRMLVQAKIKYKDAMAEAFETHKEQIGNARSLEERELRLRKYVPSIKERDSWEETLENVLLLREAVQLVYDDMSKAAMTLATQVNVVKQQILVGEVKIIDSGLMKVLSDSTMDAVERAKINSMPRGNNKF